MTFCAFCAFSWQKRHLDGRPKSRIESTSLLSVELMPRKVTLATLSTDFDDLCDQVANGRRAIIIDRKDKPPIALISAQELSSLSETLHLLKSPNNALRLLSALKRCRSRGLF